MYYKELLQIFNQKIVDKRRQIKEEKVQMVKIFLNAYIHLSEKFKLKGKCDIINKKS